MSVIKREIMPGIAIGAIVLPYGAPLTFAEVGAPFFKGYREGGVEVESILFGVLLHLG
jgi:hypothetical protein